MIDDDIKRWQEPCNACSGIKTTLHQQRWRDADYIEKEKEILMVQAKNEKPDANEKILNGMVMGRINKRVGVKICLLDQVYVKAEDGKQVVSKYVEEVAKSKQCKRLRSKRNSFASRPVKV